MIDVLLLWWLQFKVTALMSVLKPVMACSGPIRILDVQNVDKTRASMSKTEILQASTYHTTTKKVLYKLNIISQI